MTQNAFWLPVRGGTRRGPPPTPYPYHSILREAHLIEMRLEVPEGSRVHVGSGAASIYRGKLLMLNVRSAGRCVISGSTLKGAVAHYFLAVSNDIYETSSLFGWATSRSSYMSRVLFEDAPADREPEPWGVSPSWRPRIKRRGVKLYRVDAELEEVSDPVQYVEAFPPGTTFRTRVVVTNPNRWETEKVLISMGVLSDGVRPFLLGFGRPKGMGKVVVRREDLRVWRVGPLGERDEVTSELLGRIEGRAAELSEALARSREVFSVGGVQ